MIFPMYRGIVSAGGKFHSPFFESHFNFITVFTKFLIASAKLLLKVAGFELYQKNYHSLQIGSSRGISVNPSCLGWAVNSFWCAFVFANSGSIKHKLKWIVTGVVLIETLNVLRIALITVANHLNWSPVTSLDHHQTFNLASYLCIGSMMLCYIRAQKNYERNELAAKKTDHLLSSV